MASCSVFAYGIMHSYDYFCRWILIHINLPTLCYDEIILILQTQTRTVSCRAAVNSPYHSRLLVTCLNHKILPFAGTNTYDEISYLAFSQKK